jgi:hypothetical protein
MIQRMEHSTGLRPATVAAAPNRDSACRPESQRQRLRSKNRPAGRLTGKGFCLFLGRNPPQVAVSSPGKLYFWRGYRRCPPRDLKCTPCRHLCRAENLQRELYRNRRKTQTGSGVVLATLPRFFGHAAPENRVETSLLVWRLTMTPRDTIFVSVGVPSARNCVPFCVPSEANN